MGLYFHCQSSLVEDELAASFVLYICLHVGIHVPQHIFCSVMDYDSNVFTYTWLGA